MSVCVCGGGGKLKTITLSLSLYTHITCEHYFDHVYDDKLMFIERNPKLNIIMYHWINLSEK